jgi:hypothetical protein
MVFVRRAEKIGGHLIFILLKFLKTPRRHGSYDMERNRADLQSRA